MRELPRSEWAVTEERKNIEVETRAGERYAFETARFSADSLTGYRHLDTEGAFDEVAATAVPLDQVTKLQARKVDWYRTGLIGGVVIAALLAASLSQIGNGNGGDSGDGPCGSRPCP